MGRGETGSGGRPKGKTGGDTSEEVPAVEEVHKCCGCRFPLLIALLQLLLGVAIAAVAFLMLTISPSLVARETPHWAGIILCVVSILGFILYSITYRADERNSAQFIAKLLYFILCTIGIAISMLAMAFAGHHYAQTSSLYCTQTGPDCVCRLEPEDPIARTFTYTEVDNCESITDTLPMYFLLQLVLNLVQALVCAAGAFIMWKHRYQVFFVGLQVGSPSSIAWQKV